MLISSKAFQFMSPIFSTLPRSYHISSSLSPHFSSSITIGCVIFLIKLQYLMSLANPSRCHNICFSQLQVCPLAIIHLYFYLSILRKDSCKVINRLLILYYESLSHSTLFLKVQFLHPIGFSKPNSASLSWKVFIRDTCPNDSFSTFFPLINSFQVL